MVSLAIFGYLMEAPENLIELRRSFIDGAAHAYNLQRSLADLIPEGVLRLRLHQLTDVVGIWSEWLSGEQGSEEASPLEEIRTEPAIAVVVTDQHSEIHEADSEASDD
jgi:hypothetical protein